MCARTSLIALIAAAGVAVGGVAPELPQAVAGSVRVPDHSYAASAGTWVCMAKSTYGTHAATTVWSAYEDSRKGAEASALEKCWIEAANKRDCRLTRCWIAGR